MSAQHTPGPWLWDKDDTYANQLARLVNAEGVEVCNFGNGTRYYPTEGDEPSDEDKRLIAAAPDLLAALEVLLTEADNFSVSSVYFTDHHFGHKGPEMARAALAKATGKQ